MASEPKPKRRRWWRRIRRVCGVLGILFLITLFFYLLPDETIVVSKETTYLTEPLAEDGRINYMAAINQRLRGDGVKDEDNAAVGYLQVIFDGEATSQIFAELGFDSPTEVGDPLLGHEHYVDEAMAAVRENEDARSDFDYSSRLNAMTSVPWLRADAPRMADGLQQDNAALDRFVAATMRPKYFLPLVPGASQPELFLPDHALVLSVHWDEKFLRAVRSLAWRAMFRSGTGEHEAAWHDCLALLRFSRSTADAPDIISTLLNHAAYYVSVEPIPHVLHEGEFSSDELLSMRDDFHNTSRYASIVATFDWGERLSVIELMQAAGQLSRPYVARCWRGGIDWNDVLRDSNERMDQVVKWADDRIAGRERPADAIDFESVTKDWAIRVSSPSFYWAYPFSRTCRTELHRDLLHCMIFPAFTRVVDNERKCAVQQQMVDVAFALSLHRAEQGSYPESLDALVPTYLDTTPIDPFDKQPLRYRQEQEGNGYRLWSIGPYDGDNGGWTELEVDFGDVVSDGPDIVFLVPQRLPALPTKEEAGADAE